MLTTLERYLRDAGHPDPALGARLLFAAIDGVAQHFALDPENYPLDAVADHLIASIAAAPMADGRTDAGRSAKRTR